MAYLPAKSCIIMLKRKIINELEFWMKDSPKKALLLKGAPSGENYDCPGVCKTEL